MIKKKRKNDLFYGPTHFVDKHISMAPLHTQATQASFVKALTSHQM